MIKDMGQEDGWINKSLKNNLVCMVYNTYDQELFIV